VQQQDTFTEIVSRSKEGINSPRTNTLASDHSEILGIIPGYVFGSKAHPKEGHEVLKQQLVYGVWLISSKGGQKETQ
jgi:hypothetical protein